MTVSSCIDRNLWVIFEQFRVIYIDQNQSQSMQGGINGPVSNKISLRGIINYYWVMGILQVVLN